MFSDNLVAVRKMSGLSQLALATRVGVHEKTVRLWERGKTEPNSDTRRRVAEVLGREEHELFNDKLIQEQFEAWKNPPKPITDDDWAETEAEIVARSRLPAHHNGQFARQNPDYYDDVDEETA